MKGLKFYFAFLIIMSGNYCFSQEICNNGKDDDNDGLIDLHDPDCQCHFNVTGNLLQNGSFESYSACPTKYSYSAESHIADHWHYGTYTNINTASYYHNLNCSYDSGQVMLYLPPALPLPDGKGFMSITQYNYLKPDKNEKDIAKVYIGQCLQSPLVAGVPYTLSLSAGRFQSFDDPKFKFKTTPFTVAIFGNADCNAVPFGVKNATSNGCPTNYAGWQLLGKVQLVSKGKWVQCKINFSVPSDINVIEIGPDCSLINPDNDLQDSTTYLDYYVYDLDDIHLLPTKDFHFQYIKSLSDNPCDKDSVIEVPFYPNTEYQWYKESVAIIGATSNMYHLPAINAEGNYNVVISNPDSCLISEPYKITSNPLKGFYIPNDTSICENDSLLLAPAIDGVVYNCNGLSGNFIKIYKEGIYEITASTENGCSKNFTVNVHSQNCGLFMPNAFTPNGDGKNDVFRIPAGAKIELKTFSIFDRWGNQVFSTNKKSGEWDGKFHGKPSAVGTYIYIISGKIDNKKARVKGFVTLVR